MYFNTNVVGTLQWSSADEASAPVTGSFPIAVAFSEPVTGFELEDLVVGNGSASERGSCGRRWKYPGPQVDGTPPYPTHEGVRFRRSHARSRSRRPEPSPSRRARRPRRRRRPLVPDPPDPTMNRSQEGDRDAAEWMPDQFAGYPARVRQGSPNGDDRRASSRPPSGTNLLYFSRSRRGRASTKAEGSAPVVRGTRTWRRPLPVVELLRAAGRRARRQGGAALPYVRRVFAESETLGEATDTI